MDESKQLMSADIHELSKTVARRFLLLKQFLLPPRDFEGFTGIKKVLESLRSVQYDPQNPCGRNIDIFLQARVNNIHPCDYYRWLYEEHEGIESYDKELCVVPIEDLFLCHMRISKIKPGGKRHDFMMQNKEELNELLETISEKGPLCSSDIKDGRKVDIFWETAKWGKAALDSLWKNGDLVISKRENGRKYYDLPKNVYGNRFVSITERALRPEQVLRRSGSVGILPKGCVGQGWLGLGTSKQIKPIVDSLIQGGKLREIKVENVKRTFVINTSDDKLMTKAMQYQGVLPKVSFLAPLDNLLWDRTMIKEIFDFNYKWEVYTPKKERLYGHYVLPILYGDKFVGRIEPVLQKDGVLEIKGFWLETDYKWNAKIDKAFWKYIDEFQAYLEATSVRWVCNKPS